MAKMVQISEDVLRKAEDVLDRFRRLSRCKAKQSELLQIPDKERFYREMEQAARSLLDDIEVALDAKE